jgi:hypothetical protein
MVNVRPAGVGLNVITDADDDPRPATRRKAVVINAARTSNLRMGERGSNFVGHL